MEAKWQVGCFSRPWSQWSFDEALDSMQAAGFGLVGLLGGHTREPFIYSEATPETLDHLQQRIQAHGMTVNFARLHIRPGLPLQEDFPNVQAQIDRAQRLGIKYLMAFASDKPEEYDPYYRLMFEAATYAAPLGIQIVFKPHGGCSASADEMLECIEKVHHPNFCLWYDAGNIIHYTGKDPVKDVERVARYVTGFCAKDCAELKGEVMIQFGEGKVDFAGVFHKLQAVGFDGPVMIECCAGQTLEEVTAKSRENRLFLENLFASL
jgi:sugar phosphate isomerase/epimerase